MRRKNPITTVSADRKLVYTDYGDKMLVSPAPRGAYGTYQTSKLPVRPSPPPTPSQVAPVPKPPTARQLLRKNLGLDSIGKRPK